MLNGIVGKFRAGMTWRDVRERYGSWASVSAGWWCLAPTLLTLDPFVGFFTVVCMLVADIVSAAGLARGFGGDYRPIFVTGTGG